MKTLFKFFFLTISVVILGSFAPSEAHADTFYLNGSNGTVYVVANLRSTSVALGAPIYVDTYIYACGCATNVDTVFLQGGANGSLSTIIYSSISAGNTVYGSANIGTAQSTPGSYGASFTAGMNIVADQPPVGYAYVQILCNGAFYCSAEMNSARDGGFFIDNLTWTPTQVFGDTQIKVMSAYTDDCMYGYSVYPSAGNYQYLSIGETLTIEVSCY